MTIQELKNTSIEELEHLCNAHPYSSIFSTVLAKKAYEENHPSYRQFLNQASLRSPNRAILKSYIESPDVSVAQPESTVVSDHGNEQEHSHLSHEQAKSLSKQLHSIDTSPIKSATEVDEGEIVLDNPTTLRKISHEEKEAMEVVVPGKQELVEVELSQEKLNSDWNRADGNVNLSHNEAKNIAQQLRQPDTTPLSDATEMDEGEIVLDNPLTLKKANYQENLEQEIVVDGHREVIELKDEGHSLDSEKNHDSFDDAKSLDEVNTEDDTQLTDQNVEQEPVSFTGFSGGSIYLSQNHDVEDFRFVQPEIEQNREKAKPIVDSSEPPKEKPSSSDSQIEIQESLEQKTVESISEEAQNTSMYKTIVNLLKDDQIDQSQPSVPIVVDVDLEETQPSKLEQEVDHELESLYAQASYELKMEQEIAQLDESDTERKIETLPKSSDFEIDTLEEHHLDQNSDQKDSVDVEQEDDFTIELESIPDQIGDSTQTNSFTGWLNQLSNMGTDFSQDQKKHQQKTDQTQEVRNANQPMEIDEKPAISDVEVKRLAKKSLEPSNAFYTETFGYVYELQEKWSKAIEVYEYLSLQNPEKSGYFADRIKLLKEKLK